MYTTPTEIRNTVTDLNAASSKVAALQITINLLKANLDDAVNSAWVNNEVQGSNEAQRKAAAALMFPELRKEIQNYETQMIFAKSDVTRLENVWSMCRKLIDLEANAIKSGELPYTGNIELEPSEPRQVTEAEGGPFPIVDSDVDEQTAEIMGIEEELAESIRKQLQDDGQVDSYDESELRQQEIDEEARMSEIYAEAEAEARAAQYDDDPNPYAGDYSEE